MQPKIHPYSKTWNQWEALASSPWKQFLLKEMPVLLEDAYTLAQEMLPLQQHYPPAHLKKMTTLLQEKVTERITQKMQERGVI